MCEHKFWDQNIIEIEKYDPAIDGDVYSLGLDDGIVYLHKDDVIYLVKLFGLELDGLVEQDKIAEKMADIIIARVEAKQEEIARLQVELLWNTPFPKNQADYEEDMKGKAVGQLLDELKEFDGRPKYSEGILGDGWTVILKDGQQMTSEEIVKELNALANKITNVGDAWI